MKPYKLISFTIGVFILLFASCKPIEDRDTLSNSFDPNAIDLQVVQATTGGNKLSIQMNTKGVIGYWDYIIDKKYTDRVEVVFPFTGEHTFTFHITTPYMTNGKPDQVEFGITKTVTVKIDQLDEPLPDPYYALVGDDLGGKTWVFDGGPDPDGGFWWYMADPTNWEAVWWNAAGDCCPPANIEGNVDSEAQMVFDLAGGANYTYYRNAGDTNPITGVTWKFSADYKSLTISDPTRIPGYQNTDGAVRANLDGTYEIIELTADKLMLYTPASAGGTGWIWVFKPAS